jgi:Spy/CpxP family protein refolding chaperone
MFIGFAIGTICLIGLVRAVARRKYGGMHPFGGYSYGFAGHQGGCGGHRRDFGRHHRSWNHHAWEDDSPPWRGDREGGGPWGRGDHEGGPWGRGRGVVYSILGRIEATPGQEKAIFAALDELKETARELRGTGREVRAEVARAIRGPLLDDVVLEGATARIDDATVKLRAAARTAIVKIHEVLDDRQRKMVGDMIDTNWRGGW